MELSEVILALVGALATGSLWIVKTNHNDIKKIEDQLFNLPKEYVLKDDYRQEIVEIKKMLSNIFDILRESKGND